MIMFLSNELFWSWWFLCHLFTTVFFLLPLQKKSSMLVILLFVDCFKVFTLIWHVNVLMIATNTCRLRRIITANKTSLLETATNLRTVKVKKNFEASVSFVFWARLFAMPTQTEIDSTKTDFQILVATACTREFCHCGLLRQLAPSHNKD